MGHLYVDVELIDLYLKKNGINNVNVLKYLNNSMSYIQNEICSNNKILLPANSKIHDDIVNIIKQNHFYNNYIIKKDIIISKMLCNKKHLNKVNKKKIIDFKKQILDTIESKRLLHTILFENK